MRADTALPAAPADRLQGVRQWIDAAPDLSAWALITAPVRPSLREAHPDTDMWGEWRVDPGLVGLDTGRARPIRVEIGHPDGEDRWRLPVADIVPSALAWHPRLPLVAGLALRGRRAHPWIADHRARTVVRYGQVRAATSLTCLGGAGRPPLTWCGSDLVILTPAPPPAGGGGAEPSRTAVVCEARGPGWPAFPQGVPELAALAAVRVAELDPGTGTLRTLTGPLLVRELEPAPGGGHLLVTHLDEDASHSLEPHWAAAVTGTAPFARGAGARPVPARTRWAAGAPDVLAWPDADHRVLMCPAAEYPTAATTGIDLPDQAGTWWPLWHGGQPHVFGTREEFGGQPHVFGTREEFGGESHVLGAREESGGEPHVFGAREEFGGEPHVFGTREEFGGQPHVFGARKESDGEPHTLGTRAGGTPYLSAPGRTTPLPAPSGLRLGRPCPAGDASAGFLLDCRDAEGRYGVATLDPDRAALTLAWAAGPDGPSVRTIRAVAGPSGQHLVVETAAELRRWRLSDGTLTSEHTIVRPAATTSPAPPPVTHPLPGRDRRRAGLVLADDGEGTAPGPLLLWLRAHEPGAGGGAAQILPGGPAAHLDLVPRWPHDADAAFLHTEITGSVRGALDTLARLRPGILDRGVVVGGHSFGATLALYAMAHIPDLTGAVVHSGCYNRTLTPGGFQYERRSYWQAPEVYHAFSALLFAHRLDRPVLIAHGTQDANPSTTPDQAVALYRGIVAAGGHARLVLLPGEGHNFQYEETHRTLAQEHRRWLDRCARPPQPPRTHLEEVTHGHRAERTEDRHT
ncbi:hypothetical protein DMA15_35730 [Streptomyces sp. WAC 01529]|uniref:S9 family peptidase n=1 Tax=Streptomyces sp. WAC 01529 TaxID=2203205 RepID=UPI000F6F010E|nr:prolyl oligopeptidase family serine peptidase [Streptomyces sp. WAC 01529]AZM57251.1 hypothetical protein DMA15_35730 [Streptomyces sp. WAC 01529]